MESEPQLYLYMERFRGDVNRLLLSPCLDTAMKVNIASLYPPLELEILFHEIEPDSKKVSLNEAAEYVQLVGLCLNQFDEMIPRLNGDAWHVDLCREQMQWRGDLVRMLIPDDCYEVG